MEGLLKYTKTSGVNECETQGLDMFKAWSTMAIRYIKTKIDDEVPENDETLQDVFFYFLDFKNGNELRVVTCRPGACAEHRS